MHATRRRSPGQQQQTPTTSPSVAQCVHQDALQKVLDLQPKMGPVPQRSNVKVEHHQAKPGKGAATYSTVRKSGGASNSNSLRDTTAMSQCRIYPIARNRFSDGTAGVSIFNEAPVVRPGKGGYVPRCCANCRSWA